MLEMQQCADGHDEVVYVSTSCPVCEALMDFRGMEELKDELQEECERKDSEIADLKDTIQSLQADLEAEIQARIEAEEKED